MSFQEKIDQSIRAKQLYFIGDKLPSDWYEAFSLYLPLADAGDPKAQYNIGRMYELGNGVDKNQGKAFQYFKKSADQGDLRAIVNLANMYKNGCFVEKSQTMAMDLYKKAMDSDDWRATVLYFDEKCKEAYRNGDVGAAKEYMEQLAEFGKRNDNKICSDYARMGIVALCLSINEFKSTALVKNVDKSKHSYSYIANGNSAGGKYTLKTVTYDAAQILEVDLPDQYSGKIRISFGEPRPGFFRVNEDTGVTRSLENICKNKKLELAYRLAKDDVAETKTYQKICVRAMYSVPIEDSFQLFDIDGVLYFSLELNTPKLIQYPAFPKEGCFVLTACYGTYDAPTVFAFRQFRDNQLSNTKLGREFINWYYTYGPKMADYVSNKPHIKAMLRAIFTQISKILPK